MSQKLETKAAKLPRKEKSQIKSRLKNLLMFLPNMVKLLGRLLTDKRVPATEKALFAAAIIYVIVPLDFIPDIFPFIGQVDDLYLVALTLLRLLNRTDERVVRENWAGGGDVVTLANSIASLAPMLLPKRVSRVLSAQVEPTSAGEVLRRVKERNNAVLSKVTQNKKSEPF
ncbi:MAG: DUF1232 domain-containing protein [Acidobacteria bacterium]|nr:DUF1232 domain-containing protein [Acidobacteriota bacterium]MCA1638873.1 DUF1232 domain-containing protein [Acidobacteriota bacterium]